jgi:hypothetical protein
MLRVFVIRSHHGGGGYFLKGKFRAYLDRLRENLQLLDEAVENAQATSKAKQKDSRAALQWMKMLRDLVELREGTLLEIKAHLLGRDETGAVTEPPNQYDSNPEVMFERDFQRFLEPWNESDLKLECEDCGVESEQVSSRAVQIQAPGQLFAETENHDLCDDCYEKRTSADEETPDQARHAVSVES